MRWIERHWQQDTLVSRLLLPLSFLYCAVTALNRYLYRKGWRHVESFDVPILVVGNITVGGTGKTPLVVRLAQALQQRGWRPGIVTRGYGGRAPSWPQFVGANSSPDVVGDEPVLLARRSGVPVVSDPNRPRGVRALLDKNCNVILSDDGLQHYRLRGDVALVVVDGERRFGNDRCLPAGPLREPVRRLAAFDTRIAHGKSVSEEWSMQLAPIAFRRVGANADQRPLNAFAGHTVHAVAGIGYPARFFKQLRELGVEPIEHPFPDHHRFQEHDLQFADGGDIIMTEKDAVKCERFATERLWFLAVEAKIDAALVDWLEERLRKCTHG